MKDLEIVKYSRSKDCQVLLNKIEQILSLSPFPFGKTIKKIKGISPSLYRLRVNAYTSYRVFYRIVGNSIFILKIVSKKDADKVLKNYF